MTRRAGTLALLLFVPALPACDETAPGVSVYAAASTAPFMTAFARAYEERTGVRVRCSFAASSTLARQIEAGAPADIFVSANPQWMDRLEAAGRLAAGRRRDLLANDLVLAVAAPPESPATAAAPAVDLAPGTSVTPDTWPGRIAIGDPDHVPVGIYARQALRALGWWDDLEPRLVPADDARAAVRLLTIGEVAAAIVYRSDTVASREVVVAARFAPGTHDAIRYPVALRKGASTAASEFLLALTAPDTEPLRTSFGFTVPR